MERARRFAVGGVTVLAMVDDQAEAMTSLPKRSRFVVLVLLGFCIVSFMFFYMGPEKPTVRAIDNLKKAWHMGEYGQRAGSGGDQRSPSTSNITSAKTSSYRFATSNELLVAKGSTLRLVIEARDSAGRKATTGGDMWYATINSLRPKASAAGRVVDNGDGTYDVTFHAGWAGVARIDVILAHPSEAVAFAEGVVWPAEERAVWVGAYREAGHPRGRTHAETCVLRRTQADWAGMCEYWYPRQVGYSSLICGKPPDGDVWTCDDLVSLKSLGARNALAVAELIEGREYLFARENVMQMVEDGPKHVQIEDTGNYQPPALPPCRSSSAPQSPRAEGRGFWLRDEWHSLHCHVWQWGAENATSGGGGGGRDAAGCLRGRAVLFLGDQTARQWFEALHDSVGRRFFLRDGDAHYRFERRYPPPLNLSVLYQARPLLSGPAPVPLAEVRFEVDVLDGIGGPGRDCHCAVLLSPWAHTRWDRASFLERLGLIRDAVLRLRARCPEARVVVAGPHPMAHGTSESSTYADNVLLRSIRDAIGETFRGTGVPFLDMWDMSLAYPSPNKLILPNEVIQQGVNRFLSYVC